ncbi:S-crystallin SL11-like [Babylonia areolata]|uniref:S-crystallin SL11-like n=1 Tax=Babylonia areolata TaxID=304850 RepID=UPI003FCFEBD2
MENYQLRRQPSLLTAVALETTSAALGACQSRTSNMSGIKLIYFDGRGRGEVLRLLLTAAGQKFEDKRLQFQDWGTEKAKARFNSLPNLVYGGKTYGQSLALVQFLAREFGMYGKNNTEALRADEAGQFLMEIRTDLINAAFEHDPAKKEELAKKAKESVPNKLAYLEGIAVENGKNSYFTGAKLTYADVMLFDSWNMIIGFVPEADTGKDYPELKKIMQTVQCVPSIKSYDDEPLQYRGLMAGMTQVRFTVEMAFFGPRPAAARS